MSTLLILAVLAALGFLSYWIFSSLIGKLRGSRTIPSDDAGKWSSISLARARSVCLPLLMDESKFSVTESPLPPGSYPSLAPMLAEFFERFESIQPKYGDMRLDRRLLESSAFLAGAIRIGTDTGGFEIVTKANMEAVYEIDTLSRSIDQEFPSIYHLILDFYEDVKGT